MAGIQIDGTNQKLILDSDADTYLEAATDDTIKVYVSGAEDLRIGANAINVLSGTTLTIDSGATITNSGTANGFSSADPSSADGDTLGTASAEWSDLYLADGGVIYLGNDQDVTLTHVADTGILLNSTRQLQFNDSSQYINAPSNAILDINATDEIELNATAVDLNGTLDVSGTSLLTGRVGVVTAGDLGAGIHIRISDTGASVDSTADGLVIEDNTAGGGGLSILSPTDDYGTIAFGDSGDNNIGKISYNHTDNSLRFSANASERMRILSGGEVVIPPGAALDASSGTDEGFSFNGDNLVLSRSGNACFIIRRTSNDGRVAQFFRENTERGYIEVDGSSTTYSTSSDYRLKENIVDLTDAITRIKTLKPKRFNFIGEADTRDGFIAHEVTAVPEAVSGTKDQVDKYTEVDETKRLIPEGKNVGDNKKDKDGNDVPVYQGIDPSKMVALLTAALQEAITKIETLEAKVAVLEG